MLHSYVLIDQKQQGGGRKEGGRTEGGGVKKRVPLSRMNEYNLWSTIGISTSGCVTRWACMTISSGIPKTLFNFFPPFGNDPCKQTISDKKKEEEMPVLPLIFQSVCG